MEKKRVGTLVQTFRMKERQFREDIIFPPKWGDGGSWKEEEKARSRGHDEEVEEEKLFFVVYVSKRGAEGSQLVF